ncbi:trp operon repressor [Parendozoicomonas haliclonae]|uniref:Trp operon repressor homolog n=1 Tax=Parendozoicomonas haliclonae TaxID=1960125 RepID=A0A1X7ALN8_9GAMM|nr:trp operon repressor [Parendozoicomonas haliclonae]SMA49016.1 Trp operon repressor [Parendozoicomonas haliclonae]
MAQNAELVKGWQKFIELFDQDHDEKALNRLFSVLLTSEERTAISHRIEILSSLLEGNESQRDLSARLQISIATVTRGSNNLKQLSDKDKAFLRTLLLDE